MRARVSNLYLPAESRHKVLVGLAPLGVGQDGALVLLALPDVEHRDLVRLPTARHTEDVPSAFPQPCGSRWNLQYPVPCV